MKNKVQDGNSVEWLNNTAAAVVSGELVVVNDVPGIADGDCAIGASVTLHTEGVFTVPKAAPLVIAQCKKLFYDAANAVVTTDEDDGASPLTAFVFVGYAWSSALSAATTIEMNLPL